MKVRAQALLLALLIIGQVSLGADWPQWRHDTKRSGATDEELPSNLKQQWVLPLGKPAPAYVHQYRMCADYSYAPVAADGMLFVPSGVTDHVMAFDLATGSLKWRYVTDGPVRFAPVYDNGKLYFASDDGHLYCVGAKTGKLFWRIRGVPAGTPDMLMLVNGRMVSRWPARGAPVLSGGTVYFGAGIWPEEGVYQNAVDAETGKLLWQSDALALIKEGMCDHGQNLDLSLPPHGYPAIFGNRLSVSSGRTLAAWFDVETGAMDPYTSFYVKKSNPRGTWYVAGNDDFWVQGGNWFGTRPDAVPPRPKDTVSPLSYSRKSPDAALFQLKHRPFLAADVNSSIGGEISYSEPVFSKDTAYVSLFEDEDGYRLLNGDTFVKFPKYNRIVAKDLTKPTWKTVKAAVDMGSSKKQAVSLMEFPVKWELKTSMKVLAKAGGHLIAGEQGRIAAIAIPQKGAAPKIVWEAKIDGNPVNTLVADGKLVTVTDTGRIYCFGAGAVSKAGIPFAETVETSPENGFALVLGWGDGRKVAELANDPAWRVVVLEKDSAKVAAGRAALNKLGLYGRRAQVIPARDGLELTPYWANLVVVSDGSALGQKTWQVAVDAMRPFSGKMPNAPAAAKKPVAGKIDYEMDGSTLCRISAPEGSSDWTQESSGGDNSFVGQDKLVKWPLGILWYSGDFDRFCLPDTDLTHIRQPYPLVKDGRLLMFTHETLHVMDIYTGNYLRKITLPKTPYVNTRRFINRLYGKPTDRSYVLAGEQVYCVTGEKILAFDVNTGEQQQTLVVPEQLRAEADAAASERMTKKMRDYDDVYEIQPHPHWTEVRVWNDFIVAKLGNTLLAVDRHTGKLKWSRQGALEYSVCTIGGDILYALDCIPDEYTRKEEQLEKTGVLFAVNLADGRELWSRKVNYMSWPKVTSSSIFPWMKPAMPSLGYNAKHRLLVMNYNGLSVRVFKAADGTELWGKEVPKVKEPSWVYSPNILDDHIMMSLSKHQGGMGQLVDILTGEQMQDQANVPRARTCGRMIGNSSLLSYRDGATELYDVGRNLTIPLNSVRTGCTTSYIPACGIMSAPNMGHGCVCNYPMFSSLAMYHLPGSDAMRPEAVKASWGADQRELALEPKKKGSSEDAGKGTGKEKRKKKKK